MSDTTSNDLTPTPTVPRSIFAGWSRPFTWIAAVALGLTVVAALTVAAAAAALLGLLIAFGALVLRLSPRKRAGRPVTLEGRATPDGWVVEAAHR